MLCTLEGGLEALHFADPQWINNNGNAARNSLWCLSGLDQQIDRAGGERGPNCLDIGTYCPAGTRLGKKCGHIFCRDKGYRINRSARGKQVYFEICHGCKFFNHIFHSNKLNRKPCGKNTAKKLGNTGDNIVKSEKSEMVQFIKQFLHFF